MKPAMFEKLVHFLVSQQEASEEEEQQNMLQVWQEEENLIHRTLNLYAAVLDAWSEKPYHDSFDAALTEAFKVFSNDSPSEFSPDFRPDLENGFILKEDYLLTIFKQMLEPEYSPPRDCLEVHHHLTALWLFYRIVRKLARGQLPLSISMRFNLCFIKLHTEAFMLVYGMMKKGKRFDRECSRINKIRSQKRKEENRSRVLITYDQIDVTNKSRHRIAKEIFAILQERYKNPPGLNTIKRRLTEAGLEPFI